MRKLLTTAGKEFAQGFLTRHQSAIQLRSRDPGFCWKSGGLVSYAVLAEFGGPSMDPEAPTMFRLRMNIAPPPALPYHLQSPAVRLKLGIIGLPNIATEPTLEVTTRPEEMGKFGAWLTDWIDAQFCNRATPPASPSPLHYWGVGENMVEKIEKLDEVGRDWLQLTSLWTEEALCEFRDFWRG